VVGLVEMFTRWDCLLSWSVCITSMVIESLIELGLAFSNILDVTLVAFQEVDDTSAFAVNVVEDLVCPFGLLAGEG